MTKVEFIRQDKFIIGYKIQGHSSENELDLEGKIICSSVSSVAYMTANTLSEIIKAKIDAKIDDAVMEIKVLSKIPESQVILEGLKLHLVQLSKDFPKNITIISEV